MTLKQKLAVAHEALIKAKGALQRAANAKVPVAVEQAIVKMAIENIEGGK